LCDPGLHKFRVDKRYYDECRGERERRRARGSTHKRVSQERTWTADRGIAGIHT